MKWKLLKEEGFTLVEALLSIGLLLIYSVLFAMASTHITRSSHNLIRITQSLGIADALIAEVRRGDSADSEYSVISPLVNNNGNISVTVNQPMPDTITTVVFPNLPSPEYPPSAGGAELALDGYECSHGFCRFVYLETANINGNDVTIAIVHVVWKAGSRYESQYRVAVLR